MALAYLTMSAVPHLSARDGARLLETVDGYGWPGSPGQAALFFGEMTRALEVWTATERDGEREDSIMRLLTEKRDISSEVAMNLIAWMTAMRVSDGKWVHCLESLDWGKKFERRVVGSGYATSSTRRTDTQVARALLMAVSISPKDSPASAEAVRILAEFGGSADLLFLVTIAPMLEANEAALMKSVVGGLTGRKIVSHDMLQLFAQIGTMVARARRAGLDADAARTCAEWLERQAARGRPLEAPVAQRVQAAILELKK